MPVQGDCTPVVPTAVLAATRAVVPGAVLAATAVVPGAVVAGGLWVVCDSVVSETVVGAAVEPGAVVAGAVVGEAVVWTPVVYTGRGPKKQLVRYRVPVAALVVAPGAAAVVPVLGVNGAWVVAGGGGGVGLLVAAVVGADGETVVPTTGACVVPGLPEPDIVVTSAKAWQAKRTAMIARFFIFKKPIQVKTSNARDDIARKADEIGRAHV